MNKRLLMKLFSSFIHQPLKMLTILLIFVSSSEDAIVIIGYLSFSIKGKWKKTSTSSIRKKVLCPST